MWQVLGFSIPVVQKQKWAGWQVPTTREGTYWVRQAGDVCFKGSEKILVDVKTSKENLPPKKEQ